MTTEPTINEDLIKQYFDAGDLNNLITLFDHLRKCALRAEQLSLIYQHQMFELHKRLDASRETLINEPRPRRVVAANQSDTKPVSKPRAPKDVGTPIDIDLS